MSEKTRVLGVQVAAYLHERHERGEAKPGEWQFFGRVSLEGIHGLNYVCPCGCGRLGALRFRTAPDAQSPSWEWDGDELAPTLKPSVHSRIDRGGCGWHGYLTAGVWESV